MWAPAGFDAALFAACAFGLAEVAGFADAIALLLACGVAGSEVAVDGGVAIPDGAAVTVVAG